MLNILLDMGIANQDTCWTKNKNNINILVTDQMDIALAQRNAKPTYIMEFYSKVPLRPEGPTIYLLKGAIESIRSKFMHPDLYQDSQGNFVFKQ
jgi:hypothetical protein